MMTKGMLLGALAGLMASTPACDSSGQAEQATPVCVGLPAEGCEIDVEGQSFVRAAIPITDGVSTARLRHAGGRFCMSGKLDPGPTNENWGAVLALPVAEATTTGIAAPFDAAARGITQVQLTIEQPPIVGLRVQFAAVQRVDCLEIPACFTSPFILADGNGDEMVVEEAGTITAPIASFVQPSWGDPTLAFDANLIAGLQLQASPLPSVVLDYDFCVRDVRFLDGAGREVLP